MTFFQKIRGRLVLSSLIMIFPAFFILIFYSLAYVLNEQHESNIHIIEDNLNNHKELISNYIDASKADLRILSQVPPIEGIVRAQEFGNIDPQYNIPSSVWFERLSIFFTAILQSREMWYQVSYIDKNGKELLRLNRAHDQIQTVNSDNSKNPFPSMFLDQLKLLEPSQIYISDIILNRENDNIILPYQPTIYFASPVFDSKNDYVGAIVINGNAKKILYPNWQENDKYWMMLIDNDGYYVMNQKYPTKEWGSPLNIDNGMSAIDDFGANFKSIINGTLHRILYDNVYYNVYSQKIPTFNNADRFYYLLYLAPHKLAFKNISSVLLVTLFVLFLGFISAVGISMMTSKTFSEPLVEILDAVVKFREGNNNSRSPLTGPLEMRQLAQRVNEMADSIVQRQQTLEKEVESRTEELDDSRRAALSMMQDAHIQRERAENALVQLESANQRMITLSGAIEQSPAMVMIINIHGEIEYANPSFYSITGFEPGDVLNQSCIDLYAKSQPADLNITEIYKDVLDGNKWAGETINVKKDGTTFWEFSNISPVRDDDNEITRLVAVKEDVTARKQAAIELQKAKDEAEAANKAKSSFLANMSHEIRTPMNAILGMSHLLYKTGLNSHQTDYVIKIENALKNLLGIINDILDFSKIEAGKMELENTNFKIESVIQNIVDLVQPRLREKDIELVIFRAMDVPEVLIGDQLRLGQILLNLANNAVKFTHDGEIIINIEVEKKLKNSCILSFSIRDTGVGMTAQQRAKLFEAFGQADVSITRKYGGTGLGLTISKRLVEMMNGRISVESEHGMGSVFHFTAGFGIAEHQTELPVNEHVKVKKLNLLVVDDNVTSRNYICKILESFGLKTNVLGSSDDLIEHFQSVDVLKYDAVLLDWKLPDMNGIDTLTVLQGQHEKLPPFILMTIFGVETLRNEAHITGFWDIISKPISREQMFNVLLTLTERSNNKKMIRSKADEISSMLEPIRGASLLLVEDNEINRQVATEILNYEGFEIDIAENGKIAVDKIQNSTAYDLVLMDLHMPVMDGYTATIKIRQIDHTRDLPIVAMTADAIVGVQQQCIQAGMNDYLTKPVNPIELYNVLVKWITPVDNEKRKKGEEKVKTQIKQHVPNVVTSLEHIAGFDVQSALNRLNNNVQLYAELLGKFKRNYQNFQYDLEAHLLANNSTEARRLAHTLKGIAGNLGFNTLHKHSDRLQKAIEENDDTKIQKSFADVIKDINTIFSVIENVDEPAIQKHKVKRSENVNKKKLVEEIHSLLRQHDIGAKKYFTDHVSDFMAVMSKDDFKQLEQKLEQYNFSDAEQIVARIEK